MLYIFRRRQVQRAEAEAFANEHGTGYIETSAKTAEGVDEAFLDTANRIWDRLVAGGLMRNTTYLGGDKVKLSAVEEANRKSKSSCC